MSTKPSKHPMRQDQENLAALIMGKLKSITEPTSGDIALADAVVRFTEKGSIFPSAQGARS